MNSDKKTFHEIVDEIYNEVSVLTPFIKGNQPSTAFCLLFKLWTLKLTIRQLENLVEHSDSPYIRAIGFLYLRYVCAPAQLWDWYQYYLEDDEEVAISSGLHPTKVTVGQLIRMLIIEPKFQGTMLPRIPIPIARDLEKKLKEYDDEKRKEKKRPEHKDDYESDRRDRYDDRSRDRYDDRSKDRYRSNRSRSPRYRSSRSRSPSSRRRRDEFDDYERYRGRSRDYKKYDDDRYKRDYRQERYARDRSRDRSRNRNKRSRS